MANPLDLITTPVRIGGRIARGALGAIQDLLGGGGEEPSPKPPERDEQSQPSRPAPKRKPAAKRQASRKPKPLDDVGITRKVETVIFRDPEVPKGKIDVNTAAGVVWLRGEAKTPEMIKALEAQAAGIPEVKRVENLLHLPKTPAPTRADTPPSQQKTSRHPTSPEERSIAPTQTTSERRFQRAEPGPAELADSGQGRQPAPLGAERGGEQTGGSTGDSTPEEPGETTT